MARIALILLILAVVTAVATSLAAALSRETARSETLPAYRRPGALQKVAYVLLLVVMFGVGSGLMAAG